MTQPNIEDLYQFLSQFNTAPVLENQETAPPSVSLRWTPNLDEEEEEK